MQGISTAVVHHTATYLEDGRSFNADIQRACYLTSGSPLLVANLWDVTDRDIDKLAQAVFHKLRMDPINVQATSQGKQDHRVSVVQAVAESRDVCKLKYLNGAAPVVYGIPFYL